MKPYLICSLLLLCSITYAKEDFSNIPANLLYQVPDSNLYTGKTAKISGSRPESDSKFDKLFGMKMGRIFITYVNGKATLSDNPDWAKSYTIVEGDNEIRFKAEFQGGIFKNSLRFKAQAGQQYQINSAMDPEAKWLNYFFWVENVQSKEIVSDKIRIQPIAPRANTVFVPAIQTK